MTILWVTNSLFPEAITKLSGPGEHKGSGGWMLGLADALLQTGHITLVVAGVTHLVKKLTCIEGDQIKYFAIPLYGGDRRFESDFERAYEIIINHVQPDVLHIHGSEFPHSLAAIRACKGKHAVVSIQGLVSVISNHYLGGLTKQEILHSPTLHDFLRRGLLQQQKDLARQGFYETQLLKEVECVIGRTSWDYAHTWAINKDLSYFYCNEILRDEFYIGNLWTYENCHPHSIFLSQGRYPLKGLHKVLEALPIIMRLYPDVTLRIAGPDITYSRGSFMDSLRISTYGRIIKKIIQKNSLESKVFFLGSLNASDMKREYLNSNVFVCPSCIENSPNSIGEAQILGVPVVASYVGGIPDMMRGNEDFMYRFDDVEMMARIICTVFSQMNNINTSSMREEALKRHNKQEIVKTTLAIYNKVAKA